MERVVYEGEQGVRLLRDRLWDEMMNQIADVGDRVPLVKGITFVEKDGALEVSFSETGVRLYRPRWHQLLTQVEQLLSPMRERFENLRTEFNPEPVSPVDPTGQGRA